MIHVLDTALCATVYVPITYLLIEEQFTSHRANNLLHPAKVTLRQAHQFRKRKYRAEGPSQWWHIESNAKLKPFGYSIYGCIVIYAECLRFCFINLIQDELSKIKKE